MRVAAVGGPGVTVIGVRARLPMVAVGLLTLLAALEGGLVRLGWSVPSMPALVALHGPLMVGGFLGTVIGLERAVAVGSRWAYLAPLATAVGAVALAAGNGTGQWLLAVGSAVTVLVFLEIVRRQRALFTVTMLVGALAWLSGQVLWLTGLPVHRVVSWWVAFVVLMIAGERLELTRLRPLRDAARDVFVAAGAALLLGVAVATVAPDVGMRLLGVALAALAVWLGVFDIARRTVRTSGLPRFIAAALLSGYLWLGVAGILAVAFGEVVAGPAYDAVVHAVFVGFVMSMIFGHAPIVFPALLGVRIVYRPRFYVHLVALHASLVLRVAGDVGAWPGLTRWGGLLNATAIVIFLASTVHAVLRPDAEE
jgi:hypothetical protein